MRLALGNEGADAFAKILTAISAADQILARLYGAVDEAAFRARSAASISAIISMHLWYGQAELRQPTA